MYKYLFLLLLFIAPTAFAGTVDTVDIYSNAMRKSFKSVVIKPDAYTKTTTAYPTVYLLHGHGGKYNSWINITSDLKKYADDYGLIIVCPDGAYSSWYFDSPVDSTFKFETYIAKEVPAYIDAKLFPVHLRPNRLRTCPF